MKQDPEYLQLLQKRMWEAASEKQREQLTLTQTIMYSFLAAALIMLFAWPWIAS